METRRTPLTSPVQTRAPSPTSPPTSTSTPLNSTSPNSITATQKKAALPTTEPKKPAEVFAADGTSTAQDLAKVPMRSGQAVKAGGGVLGFLLQGRGAPLAVGPEIVNRAGNPAMKALLGIRAACAPEFSPLVELVRGDGSTVAGMLRGLDEQGRVVVDGGAGRKHTLALDEPLAQVRHQMDTTGDLNTALVTVFDARQQVRDPWQLQGFVGKALVVETYDAEHPGLAAAARKGDVSGQSLALQGVSAEGLVGEGGTLLREHWQIARVTLAQPAWSYKKDGMRLADVGQALLPGTAIEVTIAGKPPLSGTLVGVARDAMGSDYVVLQDQRGVKHALRDVVDVKAAATTRELWRDPAYGSVYST